MALSGKTPTSAGKFGLEVNGQMVGYVRNLQGGAPYGGVVIVPHPPSKSLTPTKYSPLAFSSNYRLPKSLAAHIGPTLRDGNAPNDMGLDMAVMAMTVDEKEMSRLAITQAALCEVDFGTFDASAKEPFNLDLVFQPHFSQFQPGSGMTIRGGVQVQQAKQVVRHAFKIHGYGDSQFWNFVQAVKLPVWSRIPPERTQTQIDNNEAIAALEVPNISDLELTIPYSKVNEVRDLFNKDLISASHEANDVVFEAYTQDMREKVFTLTMRRCLSYRLTEDHSKTIPMLKLTMFVEGLEVDFGSFAV